jgi:hypothetical protein
VIPTEVLTSPGAKLQLLARARDGSGTIIDPSPPVRWEGDATFDSPNANPAIAFVAPGDHQVRARIGGQWSRMSVIRALTASLESPRDAISIEAGSMTRPVDILVDAMAAGDPDCSSANDRLYTIAHMAVLPLNFVQGCPNELAAFAHDRGVLVTSLSSTRWTSAADVLTESALPPVITVPTRVWYFVESEDPVERATWDLEYANWAHRYNRAGVQLAPIDHRVSGRAEIYLGDEKCNDIESLLQFTADAGHLHVVYVAEIGWFSEPYGWACPPSTTRGDIVIISWKRPLATVVTHEVIHQMGNSSPPFPINESGHVDKYHGMGFEATNLMWAHDDATLNEDRLSLTLGQVYRVQAATDSWLNRAKLRPPGSLTKACPGVPTRDACPNLALLGRSP